MDNAKAEIAKPFPYEDELDAKSKRLDEINSSLNLDHKENELAEDEAETDIAENLQKNSRDDSGER